MLLAIGTASPNPYGLSAAQVAALRDSLGELATALTDPSNAKDAYRAAVQTKLAAFPAAASASYRVSASASGQRSLPSNEAAVFPATPALRVVEGGERKAA